MPQITDLVTQSGATHVTVTGEDQVIYNENYGDSTDVFIDGELLVESDTEVTMMQWHAPRNEIIAVSDPGNNLYNIISIHPETGEMTTILEDEYFDAKPTPHPTQPEIVGFLSNRSGSTQVYELNTETGELTQLTNEERNVSFFDYSPDGSHIVYQCGKNAISIHVTGVESSDGEETTLVDFDDSNDIIGDFLLEQPTVWNEEGILFASDKNGYFNVGFVDASGNYEWVIESEYDDIPLAWDGERFLFARKDNGANRLGIYEDDFISFVSNSGNIQDVAFLSDGTPVYVRADYQSNGDVWIGDNREFEVGKYDRSEQLVEPEFVTYESVDGTQIPAFIYEPNSASEKAVMFVHGTPEMRPCVDFRVREQALVQAGFTVLVPYYRGTSGFGREFSEASKGNLGDSDMEDVVAGAEYLRENGYNTVGAYGHFHGGYLALLARGQTDVFDAVAGISTLTDLESIMNHDFPPLVNYYEEKIGGAYNEIPDVYEERSPLTYVDAVSNPVLLFHGSENRQVPNKQSERYVEAVDKHTDADAQYVEYEKEGHYLKQTETRIDLTERLIDFYTDTL